jgi:putative PIG3 family NAD(P)H quinone oxidoreductase
MQLRNGMARTWGMMSGMTMEAPAMRVVEIRTPGGPDELQVVDRQRPTPGVGEVLIEVAAAGVNRPDLMQREGRYPPPAGVTDIPGLEISGRVVAIGPADDGGASRSASGHVWQIGEPVVALVAGGGYAEWCVAPGVQCLPVPSGLSLVDAAALPETYFTVWTNVFDRGRLAAGEWILVHGGTSGIGTTTIQLAAARGATVVATAGSDAKCRACVALGAHRAINYRTEDFVAVIKEMTDGQGVDVVLDMVGGSYAQRNLDCLARDGRLVQIAVMGGASAEISLYAIMLKRLTVTGSTLRARSPHEKGVIAAAVEREIWPLISAGRVRPVIDSVFPLDRASDAHRRLESGEAIGKVVLTAR